MIHIGVSSVLMLALLLGGIWVAAALGFAGSYGLTQLLSFDRMVLIIGKMAWQQSTSFVLVALPLFILMGEVMRQAGIMQKVYDAASKVVAVLPGGLLQTNITASMIFAACSGSSLASAATIGSVGYPIIAKRGYSKTMALGSIAAGGTLGILIPPSIIFIVYGSLAEVSIGRLFLAGILPGLLLGTIYIVYIAIRALLDPGLAPKEPGSGFREVVWAILSLWQIVILVIVVLGGIYGGVASPTEVAGIAAAFTFLFAAIQGKLNLETVRNACINTVRQTSMILLIIIMAKVLALTLIYGQIPNRVTEWVGAVGATSVVVIVSVLLLYLIMGMFFDGISMMVITVPFIVPVMNAIGVDLVWLGVLICLTIEIGLLTPPVGLNLYVMQGATGEPFRTIVRGSLPFVALQVLGVILVLLFPAIAMFVPNRLY
jgi:tripartite ATP-independent transporter DctM subunit